MTYDARRYIAGVYDVAVSNRRGGIKKCVQCDCHHIRKMAHSNGGGTPSEQYSVQNHLYNIHVVSVLQYPQVVTTIAMRQ